MRYAKIRSIQTTGGGKYSSVPTLTITPNNLDTTGSGGAATVANLTYGGENNNILYVTSSSNLYSMELNQQGK